MMGVKLQTLVYDVLPRTTATGYVIGLFVGAQMAARLLQTAETVAFMLLNVHGGEMAC